MPLAHNLKKVSKSVASSKGSVHIKGRNFKKLNRATLRDRKLTNRKAEHLEQKQNELMIIKYIQEEVKQASDQEVFGLDSMKSYIENFLSRFDDEVEQLQGERRPGRPASARQQILEQLIQSEKSNYVSGIKVPNLSDKLTVDLLRKWNGTIGGVTAFKYINVYRDMKQIPTKEETMQ
ncbi:translation machinery-associated protein 16 [Yamadazyma tenuis]|uniref:Translation machinery-associated protein 16 n=1 Tax=Candida tenuis (strain ATCC 10573 / BCRC 21748 / CBS 615 / JCM 9827 / NBRC 10315 / NRRL Y-1498 / VKM Y-70) TaxID=590646 RepID=G3BER8_CANTC|nr:uncharacterized protein CANTEDRAFT_109868 [Yamadazyma tenuis ATCC 10573]EGV60577.1 hypothetical protein CANTEDRAFT_109868 [Yamadazyma tenuis ATCC 10573]WEJ94175.1 translation machinery-associated protein 16 [Yamadazyma tenuis]